MTRRDLNLLLPLLAGSNAIAQDSPDKKKLPSATFKFDELPVKAGGENRTRAVLKGVTHKGSAVELHLTELGPGMAPHKHPHEDMVLVQYGELDVTISGNATRLTPGSVAFVASNEEHGWKNPTTGRTQYFVIALGENQG